MAFITIPSDAPIIYVESLSGLSKKNWLTFSEFEEQGITKFPYLYEAFDDFKTKGSKYFLAFYTTNVAYRSPSGFVANDEQMMMAVCQYGKIVDFGLVILVKALYRYGMPLKDVATYDDFVTQLEAYFPDGLEHIDDALQNNIKFTFLGWCKDYEDLLNDLVYSFSKVV